VRARILFPLLLEQSAILDSNPLVSKERALLLRFTSLPRLPEGAKNGKKAIIVIPALTQPDDSVLHHGLLPEIAVYGHNQPPFPVGKSCNLEIRPSTCFRKIPDMHGGLNQLQ
jgi:hypothetical protein